MSAHCFYDLPVPEEIMNRVWDFAQRVRRMPLGDVGEAVREEAIHQHKRERAARASGRDGNSARMDDPWMDDLQRMGERT